MFPWLEQASRLKYSPYAIWNYVIDYRALFWRHEHTPPIRRIKKCCCCCCCCSCCWCYCHRHLLTDAFNLLFIWWKLELKYCRWGCFAPILNIHTIFIECHWSTCVKSSELIKCETVEIWPWFTYIHHRLAIPFIWPQGFNSMHPSICGGYQTVHFIKFTRNAPYLLYAHRNRVSFYGFIK